MLPAADEVFLSEDEVYEEEERRRKDKEEENSSSISLYEKDKMKLFKVPPKRNKTTRENIVTVLPRIKEPAWFFYSKIPLMFGSYI